MGTKIWMQNRSVITHGVKTSDTKAAKYHITWPLSQLKFQMQTMISHLAKELIKNKKLLQNLTPRLKSTKSFNYCQLYLNKHANKMSCSYGTSVVYMLEGINHTL